MKLALNIPDREWFEPVRGTLALADRILTSGFRRTVRGEPTDAQVEAAMREHDYSLDRETTRAALRAAFKAGGEGR